MSETGRYFQEHGHRIFDYDPKTGVITKKTPPRDLFKSDREYALWLKLATLGPCGSVGGGGAYLFVRFLGRIISCHRLAWILQTGQCPAGQVDHINGNGLDNRWANLRVVDASGNRMNQRRRSDNATGVTGVQARGKRWIATICVRGVRQNLGSFATMPEAVAARIAAQSRFEFGPNHGAA